MTEQRDRIVKRVVHALETDQDPAALVREHFESDRKAVVEAVRETLDATREPAERARLEEIVDRELIDALRLPQRPAGRWLAKVPLARRIAVRALGVAALVTLLLLLLL